MGSLLDNQYGSWSTMNSGTAYGDAGEVSTMPAPTMGGLQPPGVGAAPTRATHAAGKPIHDEPGAATAGGFSPATLLANPATWLVITIGIAIAAARYAAAGRIL